MAAETNWICDWCGERVENADRYPKDWATIDPARTVRLGQKDVPLFPEEMCVEKTDHHPSHHEGELCGTCFQAILDALRNVREVRISKRPKK